MAAATESGAISTGGPLVITTGLDHANLRVRDVETSTQFYTGVLGLELHTVHRRDSAGRATFVELRTGRDKVFLMEQKDYQPPADAAAQGLNHICLLIDPTDPSQLQADLRARGVTIRNTRDGHTDDGRATFSVYVEDLDGHGVELEQVVLLR